MTKHPADLSDLPLPPPDPRSKQPVWEQVAIFFSLAAIWPGLLQGLGVDLALPRWFTYGLLGVALVLMIVVFTRRVRRLHRLVQEGPDEQEGPPFPGAPPGYGPPPSQ